MKCNPLRWLWGLMLIPVLTYFAVQYLHRNIEDDLRSRSGQALKSAGLSWAGSAFQGRNGLLSGKAIEDGEPSRALEVIRNVWGVYQLENRAGLIDKEDTYVWSAKRRKNSLKLSGFVPNESTRRSIIGVAKANFPGIKIEDNMQLARGVPSRDIWMGGVSYSLKQLAKLKTGRAMLSGLGLSVSGEARDFAAYRTVKSALANGLPKGVKLKRDEVSAPTVAPYTWMAKLSGGQLVLSGHVPNESARERVFARSKTHFPKVTIVDRMETARGEPAGWSDAVAISLRQLGRLNKGSVGLRDTAIKIGGQAQTEQMAGKVDMAMRNSLPKNFRSMRKIGFIEPAIKPVSPFVTTAIVERGVVRLSGYVPSDKARAALLSAAKARFKNRRIVDNMELAAGAPKGWRKCAIVGIGALGRLGNGRMDMSDAKLLVAGATQDEALANSLPGEVRAAAPRSCQSDVRIDYKAPPEPNLVWTAVHKNKQVVLSGEVPDAGTKSRLVRDAGSLFKGARIIDSMTVVGGRSRKWRKVAQDGLQMLSRLRNGSARVNAQSLTIRGVAPDTSTKSAIHRRLRWDLPGGYDGRNILTVRSDAMIWAETEAKRKAQAEAKRKVEMVEQARLAALDAARRKSEEDARMSAEAEAKRKAEEAAAMSAEAAAKRRAEEAARMSAEAAARRKSEETSRMRADAEAKRMAEQRRRTELAASLAAAAAADEARRKAALAETAAAQEAKRQASLAEAFRMAERKKICAEDIRQLAKTGTIRFQRAKANLAKASFPTLDKLAEAANRCPGLKLEIAGHTDSDGTAARNKRLSERRASAVLDYLTGAGVDANRLDAVGYGESKPRVPNTTKVNKAFNRRIEFNVIGN